MEIHELKRSVLGLIAKDKLEEAIDLISENIKNNDEINELILQSARYNDIKKQVREGIIDFSKADQVKSQIRRNILELITALEEEVNFKREVFGKHDEAVADPEKIDVFLSVGTPHQDFQKEFIDQLKAELQQYNIQLETLGSTFWALKNPLVALRDKMRTVSGCIVLAMERFHVKNGIYKSQSPQEFTVENEYYSTTWNQLEGGMAYQLNLPLLIMKEDKLKAEGIFDGKLHEWTIVHINPQNPSGLKEGAVNALLKAWVEEVHKYREKKV